MKRPTRDWVEKAEGDLLVARQSRAADTPVFDAICFHAQQCIEKYLKAVLQERGIRGSTTHDLSLLQALVDTHAPGLDEFTADLQWLTTYAVEIRYPGVSANAGEADRALEIAAAAREVLRGALEIPDEEPTESP